MDNIMTKLRNLDAYPKINEDFYSRTLSGGVITLASSIVMLLLFLSELRLYLHAVTETKLLVDTSRGETLRINFDVTFPALPCSILSLDAMDISGEQHLDVRHDIFKKRLDSHGNVIEARQDGIGAPKIEKPLQRHGGRLEHNETYCGSCYGAEASDEECCNNCEEVREAYRKKGWAISNPDLIDQTKLLLFPLDLHLNSISVSGKASNEKLDEIVLFSLLPLSLEKQMEPSPGKSYVGAQMCERRAYTNDRGIRVLDETEMIWNKIYSSQLESFHVIWMMENKYLICKREGFLQRVKDEEGEGCNIYGFLEVNKVAGNFHFAPGKSFQQSNMHVHDILAFQKDSFNISHKINRLAFGDYFPGAMNPLDGVHWSQETPSGMYQYFIKVVPTVYTDVNGHTIQSNQFSVTEHFRTSEIGNLQFLPGVFFFYDLSPIKVTFTEEHISFLHFLTNVCAIVGVDQYFFDVSSLAIVLTRCMAIVFGLFCTGVFTVSGILDSFIYHGQKAIKKKMEIGKFQ
ncbi:hypothetical protein FEM48_Zijuj06G0117500 [Ziziphus jujuba var. spinosa]|uniref:Endoplasmic reticulum-Golgi intermediate compartment protein 3-like n=1 Tax=Ziziphus jujuba var. spinosa TaxID=714518 RepID=A0A978V937_ZIZJJ|nr:hypothetical protein FEM48_Zijuj06G0117500 [Ziziphus jujuba var. spinosa]